MTDQTVKMVLKLVAALLVSIAGSWLAMKIGNKLNSKANGDIKAGWSAERNALADERTASANERIANALERAYPPPTRLPRPLLLHESIPRDGEEITCLDDSRVAVMSECRASR